MKQPFHIALSGVGEACRNLTIRAAEKGVNRYNDSMASIMIVEDNLDSCEALVTFLERPTALKSKIRKWFPRTSTV